MGVDENKRLSNILLWHKLKKHLVVRKYTDVNEHKIISNITFRPKLKEQLVVRNGMEVN
jgi:phage pi2 protein 07